MIKKAKETAGGVSRALMCDDSGATAIEYALIASATGLSLAAVMPLLGTKLQAAYEALRDAFP